MRRARLSTGLGHVAVLLALQALLACRAATTPEGALGKDVDLRGDLDAAVRAKAPPDASAKEHRVPFAVQGSELVLVWRTFEDGPNKYILSYRWEVVAAAEGVTFELPGRASPANAGTGGTVVERQTVRLRWRSSRGCGAQMGDVHYQIDADGAARPI